MASVKIETRREFKERLQAEGRWAQFLADRMMLRSNGISEKEVREQLAAKYGGRQRDNDSRTGHTVDVPGPAQVEEKQAFYPAKSGSTPDWSIPQTVQLAAEKVLNPPPTATVEMFRGKECSERECVQWVFEHLEIADVKPEMAPSGGAWGLLSMCKRSSSMRETFMQSIWPKLIPSKSQLEMRESFDDDGSNALDLIAKLQATMKP